VLKKFLSFLAEYNYLPLFKLNKDVLIQSEVKEIIVFSEKDIIEIMKGLKEKNSNFSTTIQLLVYTGLRPSDLLSLSAKDIDLNNQVFQYYSPKSKEYFQIPIHEELIPILRVRIDEIKDGQILEYEDSKAIGKAFRRYMKDLEIADKKYNLRTFRKSFVSFAHSSGLDLATVSGLVGHKKISTTQKFYNKLNITKQSSELKKLKFPSFTS